MQDERLIKQVVFGIMDKRMRKTNEEELKRGGRMT